MRTLLTFLCIYMATSCLAQLTPTLNDVLIPMRDGEFLEADVYIPAGVDSAQVILVQTPYNKDLFVWSLPLGIGLNVNTQPYIWVFVDWRGFYGSFPAFVLQPNRGEDAYDICEWIVDQSWHRDRIGTWGPSALGGIQYNLIRENHPNHTCAVPLVAHAHQSYDSYFMGGVLEKARLEQLDALGYGLSPIVLANPYYNAAWQSAESTTWYAPDIKIPSLQIGGWYDHNIDKMITFYEAARTTAAVNVQDEQWLLVGPWGHGGTGTASVGGLIQGELTYPNAQGVNDVMARDFFDYYLLDAPNNWLSTDKITYYETGKNQWATSSATTIEASSSNKLYLSDYGELLGEEGVGLTSFVSDPANPSPTIGGATLHSTLDQGPYDQISLESRSDIATFTSAVLPQDVSVSGRVKVGVYVSADQADCDISVRLVDVYPDNRNMLITDGIARMRFRNGLTQADETFMSPGGTYFHEIELPFTHYTWLSGHQIKVFIGGNSSYRYDVNLQNGGPMYTAGDTNIAQITILHDALNPSYVELPGSNAFLSTATLPDLHFSVMPNPTNGVIQIESPIPFKAVRVLEIGGNEVYQSSDNSGVLNLSALSSGVYLIEISTDQGLARQRFVKN